MKSTLPRRGFTLLELMISIAIMIFGIVMAGAAFALQNKALQAMDLTRIANSSSRDATMSIENALREAGWGVDPRYAIDLFSTSNKSVDRTSAPDDVSFIARDPMYRWIARGDPGCASTVGGCYLAGNAWEVTAMTAGPPVTLAITLRTNEKIEKGRLLLAVCDGAQNPVILTSSNNYGPGPGAVTVSSDTTAAFPYNNMTAIRACHNGGGAGLFLLNRYHYFIRSYAGVPWLMLDPGIDLDGDGTLYPTDLDDLIPIAKDVEDLQVAYMLTGTGVGPDNSGAGNWIIGDDLGVAELPVPPGSASSLPDYSTAVGDPSRLTTASANVRAIRVSLMLRSPRTDPNQAPGWAGDTLDYPENRTGSAAGGGRRRYSVVSEISLRNLESSRSFTF